MLNFLYKGTLLFLSFHKDDFLFVKYLLVATNDLALVFLNLAVLPPLLH